MFKYKVGDLVKINKDTLRKNSIYQQFISLYTNWVLQIVLIDKWRLFAYRLSNQRRYKEEELVPVSVFTL